MCWALILAALPLYACEHTTAPSVVPTKAATTLAPPPPVRVSGPIVESFHMEGAVTNEDGQPLAGAEVVVNTCDKVTATGCGLPVKVTRATTDAGGHYAMDFQAVRGVYGAAFLTGVIGYGFASSGGDEFTDDAEWMATSTSEVTRNFRLARYLALGPGSKMTATFTPDTGRCSGEADMFMNSVCRYLRVNVPDDGTVTVTVIPLNGITTTPLVVLMDNPYGSGSGTFSFSAKAGLWPVAIEIPPGLVGQQDYLVSVAFQPKSEQRPN
jgi:hypothetical protein